MSTTITTEARRIVPAGQDAVDPAARVAYFLRPPSVYDKARLRRAVTAAGARYVADVEIAQGFRRALRDIYTASGAPDAEALLAEHLAFVDSFKAELERLQAAWEGAVGKQAELVLEARRGRGEEVSLEDVLSAERCAELNAVWAEWQDLIDRMNALDAIVRGHHHAYDRLVADRQFYEDTLRLEAVRLLVAGADNHDLGTVAETGLTDAQLRAIPEDHRAELAGAILDSFEVSPAQKKRSSSPVCGA